MSANFKPSTYRDRGNSRDTCSQLSRSVAIIVPQHTTEPLAAFDVANNLAHVVSRFDDLIVEPLVVSFAMIMLEKCGNPSSSAVDVSSFTATRGRLIFPLHQISVC